MLSKYFQIKYNEMGGACSMRYIGKERCKHNFWGETWKKETAWKI